MDADTEGGDVRESAKDGVRMDGGGNGGGEVGLEGVGDVEEELVD